MIIVAIIISAILVLTLHIVFLNKDNDIIIAQKTNYPIGCTICFFENGKIKISTITGTREDGSYITKMNDSLYNDQSRIMPKDVSGKYLFKIKYLYGIITSKVLLIILLILLIITLINLNKANKKSIQRKIKKQDVI